MVSNKTNNEGYRTLAFDEIIKLIMHNKKDYVFIEMEAYLSFNIFIFPVSRYIALATINEKLKNLQLPRSDDGFRIKQKDDYIFIAGWE